MNKNYIIIFGSAVTKNFRQGCYLPSDIDVISDMEETEVNQMVTKWSKTEFNVSLPIDLHRQTNTSDYVSDPVLFKQDQEEGRGYIVLYGTPKIYAYIRNRGFASVLRMYGNKPEELLNKLKEPKPLSLLPETESYSGDCGEDKYYSGLKAFRNAAAHVKDFDKILSKLNCGKLLELLLHQDAPNWMASPDISDNPLPYGGGWSHAAIIYVSSDISQPVLRGWDGKEEIEKKEEEAIQILFNL